MKDIIIIGGGLAGLANSIILARAGLDVTLVEKKTYPFHRVCGEYISNEARDFLIGLNINPDDYDASYINKLILTTPRGQVLETSLDLGGFGISRFELDRLMYEEGIKAGVQFLLKISVNDFHFIPEHDAFEVELSNGQVLNSRIVIGAFGKRSTLDKQLNRPFFKKRSPYIGVKYHVKADFPDDTIALHIFKDGYCGMSAIENDKFCLCYLSSRDNLKQSGSIPVLESEILSQNPYLRKIFEESEILYDKPEVINEISFAVKESIVDHALMCGDAAGMIAPLCGNGMAMAMHAAKICSTEILDYIQNHHNRSQLEGQYSKRWNKTFRGRLANGRIIQNLFNKPFLMDSTIVLARNIPAISRFVVGMTHGKPF